DRILLDAALLERREVIARRPDARGELLAEQIGLAGERLEADIAITEILVAQRVEIVLPARDREVGTPPILDALEFDEAARLEAADFVGAGAERHAEARFFKRLTGVVGARKDRLPGNEQ